MPYTPPTDTGCSNEVDHNAYLAAHAAGWTHANYVAAYGAGPDDTTEAAAQRYAGDRFEERSRTYLRAHEGFCEGVALFEAESDDETEG